MNFSAREDISAPIDTVFQAVTDFDGFERQALRRGAEVQRAASDGPAGLGSVWQISFPFRGKNRQIKAELVELDSPNGHRTHFEGGGMDGDFVVDLLALSPQTTRMNISLELRPTSLAGRLLVQSIKFARTNLAKRFQDRVNQFARSIA